MSGEPHYNSESVDPLQSYIQASAAEKAAKQRQQERFEREEAKRVASIDAAERNWRWRMEERGRAEKSFASGVIKRMRSDAEVFPSLVQSKIDRSIEMPYQGRFFERKKLIGVWALKRVEYTPGPVQRVHRYEDSWEVQLPGTAKMLGITTVGTVVTYDLIGHGEPNPNFYRPYTHPNPNDFKRIVGQIAADEVLYRVPHDLPMDKWQAHADGALSDWRTLLGNKASS